MLRFTSKSIQTSFLFALSLGFFSAQALGPIPETIANQGYQDGILEINKEPFSFSRSIGPGTEHFFAVMDENGPVTVNAVIADLSQSGIFLEAEKGQDLLNARETVSAMSQRLNEPDSRTMMVINADFWKTGSVMINLFVDEGVIWSSPLEMSGGRTRSIFAKSESGETFIGLPEFTSAVQTADGSNSITINRINEPVEGLTAYTWVYGKPIIDLSGSLSRAIVTLKNPVWIPNQPAVGSVEIINHDEAIELKHGQVLLSSSETFPEWIAGGKEVTLSATLANIEGPVDVVVGGGPRLIVDEKPLTFETSNEEGVGNSFVTTKHPRSAVGKKANGELVFATVDGRQGGRSVGVTLFELAEIMMELGCTEAINLDGGGSTSMSIWGETINFPSDVSGPRPVSNALVLKRTEPAGPVATIEIEPALTYVMPGSTVPFKLNGFDASGEPVQLRYGDYTVEWHHTIDGKTETISYPIQVPDLEGTEEISVTLTPTNGSQALEISTAKLVISKPKTITTPSDLGVFEEGQSRPFEYRVVSKEGHDLDTRFLNPTIEYPEDLITLDQGVLAAKGKGAGTMTITLGDVTSTIPVSVGQKETVVIESFDKLPEDTLSLLSGVRHNEKKTYLGLDPYNTREGDGSVKFHYGMTHGESGTVKISYEIQKEFPEKALGVGIWIYGDGGKHWLRSEWRDSQGQRFVLSLTESSPGIDWNGEWRWVTADLKNMQALGSHSQPPKAPFTIENLYLVQTNNEAKTDGAIMLDALSAILVPE